MVRRLYLIISLLVCGWWAGTVRADTFKLNNGESITGEVLAPSANDAGVQIKVGEGQYQRVPWANFSQDDLKAFAKLPKLDQYVEPFIEINPEIRIKKTEVNIKQPPRLELPPRQSLFGAMFSSGLGLFIMLLLYAANVWAGYEVAIFRVRPPLLVAGLAAIPLLGFLVPIAFLSLPTKLKPGEATAEAAAEAQPKPTQPPDQATPQATAAADDVVNPMQVAGVAHPATLKVAHSEAEPPKSKPPAQVVSYQRGQFTFNRRFFETKFAGFFPVVRREPERDQVLVIKAARGEYIGQRISRIAANDLHLQVQRGQASEEVMIPFQEIQLIQVKQRDA